MAAVVMRARLALRRGVPATVLLIVLVAVGGGVVLATVAAARRSGVVLDRFLAAAQPDALGVNLVANGDRLVVDRNNDQVDARQQLAALPGVGQASRVSDALVAVADPDAADGWHFALGIASIDDGILDTLGQPIIVAGHLPDTGAADEIAVNEELAARRHLAVGDRARLGAYTDAQFEDVGHGQPLAPRGRTIEATIVGVVRFPPDLLPVRVTRDGYASDHSTVYLTRAWWSATAPDVASYGVITAVYPATGGTSVDGLAALVAQRFGDRALIFRGPIGYETDDDLKGVRRAIRIESLALLGFGIVAAVATMLLVGQVLGRQLAAESDELPWLRALGMTKGQLTAVSVLRTVPVAVVGAMLALVVAIALSARGPIGVARRADAHLGIHADWLVLGVGVPATAAAVLAAAAYAGRRLARQSLFSRDGRSSDGRSSIGAVAALGRSGLPLTAVTGARFALDRRRDSSAFALGSAVVAVVATIGTLMTATTVRSSLRELIDHPERFGAVWDVSVGNYSDPESSAAGAKLLDVDDDIASYAGIAVASADIDGKTVPTVITTPFRGTIDWTMQDGRTPRDADEIALGSNTLATLGKSIGDRVTITNPAGGSPHELTIVGRTILSPPDDPTVEPGTGALVTVDAASQLAPPDQVYPGKYVIRLRPGIDIDAAVARLHSEFYDTTTYPVLTPPAIETIERVANLPTFLGLVVAALATATLVHTLRIAVKRRRRDLAILKIVGFSPRQVSTTVAWQATTLSAIGILIGIPAGVLGGRFFWRLIAGELGVVPRPVLPLVVVVVLTVVTLVVANLVALGPSRRAAHLPPAEALRVE
jgi:hypothetical protein